MLQDIGPVFSFGGLTGITLEPVHFEVTGVKRLAVAGCRRGVRGRDQQCRRRGTSLTTGQLKRGHAG